ncbi:unnamed protein product [Cylindrotheca closterium]|uniref:PS II complex 12 kDa extrinsic protein n=1 Tax=Cylindrotheca closterium TaxID=2856 RepID=A0AAD2FY96_9STRA|nr:unnamed protein product [Cylindrotheca closterium]
MHSTRLSVLYILLTSSLLASVLLGWSATPKQGASRRVFLDTAAKVVPLVALSSPAFADDEAASAEPISVPGTTPVPSTEENECIARLKKQSDANKEKYAQQAIRSDKLSNGQFSTQYQRPSYFGVRRTNGSFEMVDPSELDELMKSGKVESTFDKMSNKTVYAYK